MDYLLLVTHNAVLLIQRSVQMAGPVMYRERRDLPCTVNDNRTRSRRDTYGASFVACVVLGMINSPFSRLLSSFHHAFRLVDQSYADPSLLPTHKTDRP